MFCPSAKSPRNWPRYESASLVDGSGTALLGMGNRLIAVGGADGGGAGSPAFHQGALGAGRHGFEPNLRSLRCPFFGRGDAAVFDGRPVDVHFQICRVAAVLLFSRGPGAVLW